MAQPCHYTTGKATTATHSTTFYDPVQLRWPQPKKRPAINGNAFGIEPAGDGIE